MIRRLVSAAAIAAVGVSIVAAQTRAAQRPRPPGAEFAGDAFRFARIADGVYHAVGTGALPVGSNAAVVVNADDVLVVDSHSTPAAAWALAEQVRTLTDRPIRYVVNTHFHWDHAHGNQIYGPGVEILGHEFTRRMIAAGESRRGRSYDLFVGGLPAQIGQLRKQVEAMDAGAERAKLAGQLAVQERYRDAAASVVPEPPTLAFDHSLTLVRGGREIRLLFLGRGHTGGDVVVHLPAERVVVTGDLLGAGPSYLGDAFLTEWPATLDRLRALDFDWVLPGHGDAFRGTDRIDHLQAYLSDFWTQVKTLHDQGLSAEEAARRVDLRAHARHYPTIRDVGVLNHGVYRAYDHIEGRIPE